MTSAFTSADGAVSSWTPMSGDQIRRARFPETSLGRRGYRPDEVDAYLGRVAAEIERWTAAYAAAATEIHRLRNFYRDEQVDPGAMPARRMPNTDAITVLAQAQLHADQLIADAQAHARAVQTDARAQAGEIVSMARKEADDAAHAYRARAGAEYTTEREQTERMAALSRSILAAIAGAVTQLDGAGAQMRAVADAFGAELTKLIPAETYEAR